MESLLKRVPFRPLAPPPLVRPAGARPELRKSRGGRALGRIEVYEDIAAAAAVWDQMEAACPASVYQTRRWLQPWLETMGSALETTPMIVVAYSTNGLPVLLMPFGIVAHERFRIIGFLGGRDSNANVGMFRPGVSFNRDDLESLFRAAAIKARLKPDVFTLCNQPESWEGVRNPLLAFPHQPSASMLHSTALALDPDAYVRAHLSNDSLKKRKKRKKLVQDFGNVEHVVARTPVEATRILDSFFAQKLARFEQLGIESDFEHPASRAFLERASHNGITEGAPAVELHALVAGDRIVATYGGANHRGRFHAMFNSYDMTPDVSRSSPGDLLLMAMLEEKCRDAMLSFDLGIGEARYKDSWCEVTEPLFDTIVPVTAKGRAFALAESARLHVKRQVKQSPWLWSLAKKLRAGL